MSHQNAPESSNRAHLFFFENDEAVIKDDKSRESARTCVMCQERIDFFNSTSFVRFRCPAQLPALSNACKRRGTTPTTAESRPAQLPHFSSWASTGARADLATSNVKAFHQTSARLLACIGSQTAEDSGFRVPEGGGSRTHHVNLYWLFESPI